MSLLKKLWTIIIPCMVDKLKNDFWFVHIEKVLAGVSLLLLAIVIFLDVFLGSVFRLDINDYYAQHLVIWVALLGASLVTRKGEHLSLSVADKIVPSRYHSLIHAVNAYFSIVVTIVIAISSFSLIFFGTLAPEGVLIPIQFFTFIIPLSFILMSVRFYLQGSRSLLSRLVLLSAFVLGLLIVVPDILYVAQEYYYTVDPDNLDAITRLEDQMLGFSDGFNAVFSFIQLPLVILLVVSAFLGAPIFVVLSGLAILFFKGAGYPFLSDIPQSMYTILTSDVIPAVPLFTLAGFILSESKAGQRLVDLFRSLLGWMPGGLSIVVVFICAFFTTITGATGVTILALGALFFTMMEHRGYKKDFTLGFLTSAGSNGLLFPPSLPIIMYGVTAMVPIPDLFIAGLLPGFLMVGAIGVMGVVHARNHKISKIPFQPKEILQPFIKALPELLLPVIIILGLFSPLKIDIIGTASISVVYILIIEVFVFKDISIKKLPHVLSKGLPIIGGILVIIAAAKGLNNFIVYEMIPQSFAAWVEQVITSKYIFLILLNIALLITGCFMDVFSAILVVAPLVIPLGVVFGIDPIHLGIIFLANLQLGYLTPPVGLNLFMAYYRFKEPLPRIYKSVLPFFWVLLLALLLITYVPVIWSDIARMLF